MAQTRTALGLRRWLLAGYRVVIGALVILGAANLLGTFGSASEVVSYVVFTVAVVLIGLQFLSRPRRLWGRKISRTPDGS